jgi:hypothetical protein
VILRSGRGAPPFLILHSTRWPLLLAVSAVLPLPLESQATTVRIDLSGSRVRYAESMRTTAVSLTPELTADWPNALFRAVASYSQLSGGGSALQGNGGFSLYTPALGAVLGELEAFGGGTRQGDVNTSQVLAVARGHLSGSNAGAWVGGGIGTASNTGARRPYRLGEVGAWARRGGTRASTTVAPTVVGDSIRFTDVNVVAVASLRRFELTAAAGARSGSQPEIFGTPVRSWASASIATWLNEHIALVVAAGRYPVDLTQGFPGGTYASAGLRLAARLHQPAESAPRPRAAPPPPMAAEAPVGALRVAPAGIGRRLLFLQAPAAESVEIAGAFSEWRPLPMALQPDGWWSLDLALLPGRYETAIRVDGGEWFAPPGLLVIRDEFGGEVGLLDVQ